MAELVFPAGSAGPGTGSSPRPNRKHSYASMALLSGETIRAVGRVLGHEKASTTLKYAHLSKFGKRRSTRIDRRTTRHPGYAASQRLRKRIEEGFGWIKTTGGMAKTRHRGLDRVGWMFTLTAAAYNLVRLPKLLAEAPT